MSAAEGTDRLLEVCFWLAAGTSAALIVFLWAGPTVSAARAGGGLAVLAVVFTQYEAWNRAARSWAGRASYVASVGAVAALAPLAVVYVPQEIPWFVPPIAVYLGLRGAQFVAQRAWKVAHYVSDGFRQ